MSNDRITMKDEVGQPGLVEMRHWLGNTVRSSDGARVGVLTAILYDHKTLEPVWLEVGTGLLGIASLYVPARGARLSTPDSVQVTFTQREIEHQPEAHAGVGFSSATEQMELSAYFGVLYDPTQDLRALREGDFPPGSVSASDA